MSLLACCPGNHQTDDGMVSHEKVGHSSAKSPCWGNPRLTGRVCWCFVSIRSTCPACVTIAAWLFCIILLDCLCSCGAQWSCVDHICSSRVCVVIWIHSVDVYERRNNPCMRWMSGTYVQLCIHLSCWTGRTNTLCNQRSVQPVLPWTRELSPCAFS